MIPPRAVVFDLGKVLLDFDYGIAVKRIQQQCRLSEPELLALINQSPLLLRYESNALSTAGFFAEVQAASGFCGTLEDFRGMFADIFFPIEPMVHMHTELRERGIPTYVFSNTNEIAIGHIRDRFPFFGDFDGYILSYEHNLMKPDPRLYEVLEKVVRRSGSELLYLDDRPENVATALDRGWRAILHESAAESRAAIVKAGLL